MQPDEFGKVTVSLGGRCPLGCAHCYTTVSTFEHDQKHSVDAALEQLRSLAADFEFICLSGDTDPFLRPKAAAEYLRRAADEHPEAHVMYTTRLIPTPQVLRDLHDLGDEMARAGRFFVGAVSVVTASYPNKLEDATLVPSSDIRFGLLRDLSNGLQPVLLALRPTLPFSVVPKDEVRSIVEQAGGAADSILGETLLLDAPGEIARRLSIPSEQEVDEVSELSFLDQPASWRKREYSAETDFAKDCAKAAGVPYFRRSISAMRHFKQYWDFSAGTSRYMPGDAVDLSAESIAP